LFLQVLAVVDQYPIPEWFPQRSFDIQNGISLWSVSQKAPQGRSTQQLGMGTPVNLRLYIALSHIGFIGSRRWEAKFPVVVKSTFLGIFLGQRGKAKGTNST
jgi:hypothetical protein